MSFDGVPRMEDSLTVKVRRSELNDWKDDVDVLNAQEWVVISGIGVFAY